MIRIPFWIVFSLAVVLTLPGGLRAQDAREEAKPEAEPDADAPDEPLVIKVYQVLDLLTLAPDYPYEGSYLPAIKDGRGPFFPGQMTPTGLPGAGGGTGGGGAGGMLGGGAGMGGGMFQVPATVTPATPGALAQRGKGGGGGGMPPWVQQLAANLASAGPRRITMAQLMDTITSVVAPVTWDEVGGPGGITPIGGALVIAQTAPVHAQVKDLLEQLRHERGELKSVTIDAEWLVLSKAQLAELKTPANSKKPSRSLNRQALSKLPEATRRFAGQITCANGQTTYIVSGRMETVVEGAIPVVGGNGSAYEAVLLTPQMGALLQVTATVLPGDERVLLNLRNSVTRGDKPGDSVKLEAGTSDDDGLPAVQIDRLNVAAQQFATSVRMPLGEPVLVGGMTFPGREPGAPEEQLYLIVEVTAGD